jgi:Mg2+ and Co2+ transporter CorA
MDTLKKFELMEKIVRELEDLQHSQQAVIQKMGKIEVDNIELGDKKLAQDLPDMHQRVADNLDAIRDILAYFADKTQNFGNKNNVDALKEQQAIDEVTGKS